MWKNYDLVDSNEVSMSQMTSVCSTCHIQHYHVLSYSIRTLPDVIFHVWATRQCHIWSRNYSLTSGFGGNCVTRSLYNFRCNGLFLLFAFLLFDHNDFFVWTYTNLYLYPCFFPSVLILIQYDCFLNVMFCANWKLRWIKRFDYHWKHWYRCWQTIW